MGKDTNDQSELDTVIGEVMANLRPDRRAILIRKIAGFSDDEIADCYHLSARSIEGLIERARQRLRRLMLTRQ